jgi:hypothetical protein
MHLHFGLWASMFQLQYKHDRKRENVRWGSMLCTKVISTMNIEKISKACGLLQSKNVKTQTI